MLRKILTTTALVTALTVPAFAADNAATTKTMDETTQAPAAQATGSAQEKDPSLYMFEVHTLAEDATQGYLASNLIGKYVYASEAEDADSLGDINDIVIGQDGTIQAVILGAGGFLGVGEKDVALDFDRLAMQETGDSEFRIVSDVTKAELEGAAEYERPDYVPEWMSLAAINDGIDNVTTSASKAYDDATKSTEEAYDSAAASIEQTGDNVEQKTDEMAAAPVVDGDVQADEVREEAMAPEATDELNPANDQASAEANWMEDKVAVESGTLEADELIGASVYDVAYNSVGEVGDVLLNADGQIEAAIVDAGGFLGLGEKEVAIDFSEVRIYREKDGDDLYVKTSITEEALDNAPEYDEDTYSGSATGVKAQ
ncbi:PRC-barrel domain-containing protein [Roseibium sp. CAU 1637]|uniref:PRC-barrel domain-containing protein n=1 Tax=Roseibium limicola TaxID=2816037 RepID=A0A939ESL2_9HYPH|nr:PRC-barrel domain-containing protein [Roseibium limicola]MBO0347357.1 PRC-barrel domain-containing protein [Roseibium limicola]